MIVSKPEEIAKIQSKLSFIPHHSSGEICFPGGREEERDEASPILECHLDITLTLPLNVPRTLPHP